VTVSRINHFEQNRPVHLARRDIYYERAVELLLDQRQATMHELQAGPYEEILFMLRTARQHAYFSIREEGKNETDKLFYEFLKVLSGNVKAVLSMLNLKQAIAHAEGFFLSTGSANHASVALLSEEYERRACDIVRCVHGTLELASSAFENLRDANLEQFHAIERARYQRACEHNRDLIRQRAVTPKAKKHMGLFA